MSEIAWEFAKLTWTEVNEVADRRIAIVPAGTLEDHGLHLPIDTDVVIAEEVCRRLAERIPREVVVLPPITYGFSPHHIDGPGTITVRWDTFVSAAQQIVSSLAYHGFRRMMFLNGHGSNEPVLDLASRLAIVENPDVLCAMTSWWALTEVQEAVRGFRESAWTGHACELETSAYLAVNPQAVRMERARADVNPHMSPHFWADLVSEPPEGYRNAVRINEYWSTVSETGTWGDPTVATAEKGEQILEAAASELVAVVEELAARPVRERAPYQTQSAQARNAAHSGPVPRFTI